MLSVHIGVIIMYWDVGTLCYEISSTLVLIMNKNLNLPSEIRTRYQGT